MKAERPRKRAPGAEEPAATVMESAGAPSGSTGGTDDGVGAAEARAPRPEAAAPPLLVVEGLSVVFDGFRLGPLQLSVAPGERVGLIGSSGAGKTTLLRAISGELDPEQGRVTIGGREVRTLDRRARARAVGVMRQGHDLVDQLRVRHNVQAGLLGRWPAWKALLALVGPVEAPEARAALEQVGLADRMDARTADLSGGQHQRVALARLLVQGPVLLLADEPVAALDPVLAGALLDLLTRLASERGRAVLCSLHQPDLALRYFDRIVGLAGGRIVLDRAARDVTPDDVRRVYAGGPDLHG